MSYKLDHRPSTLLSFPRTQATNHSHTSLSPKQLTAPGTIGKWTDLKTKKNLLIPLTTARSI